MKSRSPNFSPSGRVFTFRFHDLRHTRPTLTASAGALPKDLLPVSRVHGGQALIRHVWCTRTLRVRSDLWLSPARSKRNYG